MVYTYDQLNRLRQAQGVTGMGTANTWDGVTAPTEALYKSAYSYDANGNILSAQRYDQNGAHYDAFQYKYQRDAAGRLLRNRLYQLNDLADEDNDLVNATPDGSEDIAWTGDVAFDPLDPNINTAYNYGYDALGNLVRDDREEISEIEWTVAGKVSAVHRPAGSGKQNLRFTYGANGQRIVKEVRNAADEFLYREHYIRDAQGNLMATYRHELLPIGPPEPGTEASLKLTERPIYGSSRLGVDAHALELGGLRAEAPNPYLLDNPIGKVHYELTDHLGNVATVVTDELIGVDVDDDGSAPEYFQPFVVSAQGYEPFGSLLPGRNYSSDSYRFGFNGKENDNEVHGATGTFQDYGMRAYDTRVGRFFSVDPIAQNYPWYTPYQFAGNTPIAAIDVDGLEPGVVLGNPDQVQAINQFFETSGTKSPNYAAFELKSFYMAELNLENHVQAGNRIKVLYIQVHGTSGSVYMNPGTDGVFHTKAVPRGGGLPIGMDDTGIGSADINWYLGLTEGLSPSELQEVQKENSSNPIFTAIHRFKRMAQNVDEDGVIIMGACHAGANPEGIMLGDDLAKSLTALTGRKVLLSKDYVTQGTANGNHVLDRGLCGEHLEEGWTEGSSTGVQSMGACRDLRLNTSGPLYEITETP